jgi:serine O-acetyltransferase
MIKAEEVENRGVEIGDRHLVLDDAVADVVGRAVMVASFDAGTGKEAGDRHPKIRRGVLLSLGAKILGNIEIGEYSRVGAGSVVLKSIPAGCTAVGVPAKLVNCAGSERPSQEMNQIIDEQDNKI